jgi:hypothetical protein
MTWPSTEGSCPETARPWDLDCDRGVTCPLSGVRRTGVRQRWALDHPEAWRCVRGGTMRDRAPWPFSLTALHLFACLVRFGGCRGMGGDGLTQQGDGDGAGRKQVWLWAGGTPGSESNLEVDVLRNIGIEFGPGFRVKPRERPDHGASSSRFVPKSESNQESDQAAPIRYEIGLARRGTAAPGGEPQRQAGSRSARRGTATPGGEPQHQAQRCRDRESFRLPSSTLHGTRRPRDRNT